MMSNPTCLQSDCNFSRMKLNWPFLTKPVYDRVQWHEFILEYPKRRNDCDTHVVQLEYGKITVFIYKKLACWNAHEPQYSSMKELSLFYCLQLIFIQYKLMNKLCVQFSTFFAFPCDLCFNYRISK